MHNLRPPPPQGISELGRYKADTLRAEGNGLIASGGPIIREDWPESDHTLGGEGGWEAGRSKRKGEDGKRERDREYM